jgi:hypothetical protein
MSQRALSPRRPFLTAVCGIPAARTPMWPAGWPMRPWPRRRPLHPYAPRSRGSAGAIDRHDASVHAFVVRIDAPVSWGDFSSALDLLQSLKGEHLLRVKGIVHVRGEERPRVVQCVHHLRYPDAALPAWPDEVRSTRLVFIVRELSREVVDQAFACFCPVVSRCVPHEARRPAPCTCCAVRWRCCWCVRRSLPRPTLSVTWATWPRWRGPRTSRQATPDGGVPAAERHDACLLCLAGGGSGHDAAADRFRCWPSMCPLALPAGPDLVPGALRLPRPHARGPPVSP